MQPISKSLSTLLIERGWDISDRYDLCPYLPATQTDPPEWMGDVELAECKPHKASDGRQERTDSGAPVWDVVVCLIIPAPYSPQGLATSTVVELLNGTVALDGSNELDFIDVVEYDG